MRQFKQLPLAIALIAAGTTGSHSSISEAQAESGGLEEVVVTARYREESVQDVPVAVTAMSGNFMEDNNIMSMLDIEKYVPNVEFTIMAFAGGALSASIRGLSFDDLEKSFEPAVGVSIDGMFMGTNAGANVDFFDVASVEVLRGPQGTLFGRNTIAGAVNIKRTRPTGEFGVKLMADIGRYDHVDLKGVINFPIIPDVLAAKLTARSL
ncbi:MAG: Plug domain-containing protein, partial [Halieaceae bacterium]